MAKEKYEAEIGGIKIAGEIEKRYQLKSQEREVILLRDCKKTHAPELDFDSFLYQGNTGVDLDGIETKYISAFAQLTKFEARDAFLSPEKRMNDLATFRKHFSAVSQEDFDKFFPSIVERLYELREFRRMHVQRQFSRDDFVNRMASHFVEYMSQVDHPAILQAYQGRVNDSLKICFGEIKNDQPYCGLLFSSMSRNPNYRSDAFRALSNSFWESLNSQGFDKRRIIAASAKELSAAVKEFL